MGLEISLGDGSMLVATVGPTSAPTAAIAFVVRFADGQMANCSPEAAEVLLLLVEHRHVLAGADEVLAAWVAHAQAKP